MTQFIPPGSTLGVLGSGQLGRMFAIAARRLGYRVHVLSPDDDTPTGQVADVEIRAAYDDSDAVAEFARGVDVVTFEFENVLLSTAERTKQRGRSSIQGLSCVPFLCPALCEQPCLATSDRIKPRANGTVHGVVLAEKN